MRKKSWTIKDLETAVAKSTSFRQVINRLGLVEAGGNYVHVKRYVSKYKFDTSHFKGHAWNRGMRGGYRPIIPIRDILVKNSNYQSFKLKKRLFKEGLKMSCCELCGWSNLSPDGRIPLELDHINGDRFDNRIQNLRILCPNCHSLQSTHRGLNKRRVK